VTCLIFLATGLGVDLLRARDHAGRDLRTWGADRQPSGPSAYVVFKRPGIKIGGRDIRVHVELARTLREISRGLMFREQLRENHGMLFLFHTEQPLGFWMKNTLIPLDIIFISEELEVISAQTRVPPCKQDPCPVYRSEEPAKFVMEVNAGFVEKHGISQGNQVEIKIDSDRVTMP
jgi:uncharacterized membrane protein (UPF0127 family)